MEKYIAVAVNKGDKIWAGHFGNAPYFVIFNENAEIVDKKVNPHGAGNGHTHNHGDDQPILIKEILSDCSIFVGKQMGEESKKKLAKKLGIKTVITKKREPLEVVKEILEKKEI